MAFQRLDDHELGRLAETRPEALVAYVGRAREAGDEAAAGRALQILAFALRHVVLAVVRKTAPRHRADELADAAVVRIAEAVVSAPPHAASPRQLRAWFAVIAERTVTDHLRARKHRDLPSLDADEDGGWDVAVEEPGYEAVHYRAIVGRRLAALSPEHRRIVELRADGHASKEVAGIVGRELGTRPSVAAIDQVFSRFKRACRLEDAPEGAITA